MNYSFIIRKATPEDAPAIFGIVQESFRKYMKDTGLSQSMEALTETVEDIMQDILSQDVFVAFMDDIPVGSVRVKIDLSAKSAYISRFGVSLDFHNIGIGKSLMNLVDKLLINKGVQRVSLHTASKYTHLVRFYYGRGFYVDSVTHDKGYARALMVKEY